MGYVQEKCTGLVSEASFVIAKPREIGTEQKTHQIESSWLKEWGRVDITESLMWMSRWTDIGRSPTHILN